MRSTKKSKVIGEGKYGCVHKPSLKCKKTEKNITYKNKISKLMKADEANIELEKYKLLEEIDKDQKLYLGKPDMCSPNESKQTIEAIKQCDYFDPKKRDNYSLLVMKYGGLHLKEFADKISEKYVSDSSVTNRLQLTKVMNNFWIEVRRLFLGLTVFNNNNVIHHDLKPQNIVYDVVNNRLNYIDFGMMIYSDQVKQMCVKSKYYNASFHWSFPPEMKFMNKNKFTNVFKNPTNKQREYDIFIKDVYDYEDGKINYFMETTVIEFNKKIESQIVKKNIDDFHKMLFEDIDRNTYTTFLNKTLHTIDIYGLGIALIYVLNSTSMLIDANLSQKLRSLFMDMIHLNVFQRIEPNEAKIRFETITENLDYFH
jgi:serine/threonine protein kinase